MSETTSSALTTSSISSDNQNNKYKKYFIASSALLSITIFLFIIIIIYFLLNYYKYIVINESLKNRHVLDITTIFAIIIGFINFIFALVIVLKGRNDQDKNNKTDFNNYSKYLDGYWISSIIIAIASGFVRVIIK